jgi:hypothetical protein
MSDQQAGSQPTIDANKRGRDALAQELALVQRQTHDIAAMQFAQARIWRFVNLLVGLPAAGIAAAAGGLALSGTSHAATVGILALVSATLGSFQTVLGAQRRQATAERSGNSYLEVRNAARRLAVLDLDRLTYEQVRRRIEELAVRHEEINRTADPPSHLAIHRGRKFVRISMFVQPHGSRNTLSDPSRDGSN